MSKPRIKIISRWTGLENMDDSERGKLSPMAMHVAFPDMDILSLTSVQKHAIIAFEVWQMQKNDLCGALIKKVHDEIEKKANALLRQQDLTLSQMNVLMELEAAADHQLTLKELESLLHVAQSTAAGIVTRLEQKGFVESFTDKNDRRVKKVTITAAGLECCENAASDVKEIETKLLSGLTESEKLLFLDLLEKVFKAL